MLILQIENPGQVDRFFTTTPDTVFGLLVGALALAVVGLWVAYTLQTRSYTSKLIELNISCVETLRVLANNLDKLRDAGINMTDDLKTDLARTREHIALKIDNIVKDLRYENKGKNE